MGQSDAVTGCPATACSDNLSSLSCRTASAEDAPPSLFAHAQHNHKPTSDSSASTALVVWCGGELVDLRRSAAEHMFPIIPWAEQPLDGQFHVAT